MNTHVGSRFLKPPRGRAIGSNKPCGGWNETDRPKCTTAMLEKTSTQENEMKNIYELTWHQVVALVFAALGVFHSVGLLTKVVGPGGHYWQLYVRGRSAFGFAESSVPMVATFGCFLIAWLLWSHVPKQRGDND